jgi:hypothetical protein
MFKDLIRAMFYVPTSTEGPYRISLTKVGSFIKNVSVGIAVTAASSAFLMQYKVVSGIVALIFTIIGVIGNEIQDIGKRNTK